jgi:predicted nucleotidyltransferase
MTNLASIVDRLRAALEPSNDVLEAYLFGSVARGNDAPHSDVDVALYLEDAALARPGYGIDAEIGADLIRALGRNDVDVVVLNRASPVLYHAVLRDGVRILARDLRATTTREGNAFSRYCDYVPQLRKIEAAYRARIAHGGFGR